MQTNENQRKPTEKPTKNGIKKFFLTNENEYTFENDMLYNYVS